MYSYNNISSQILLQKKKNRKLFFIIIIFIYIPLTLLWCRNVLHLQFEKRNNSDLCKEKENRIFLSKGLQKLKFPLASKIQVINDRLYNYQQNLMLKYSNYHKYDVEIVIVNKMWCWNSNCQQNMMLKQ